MSVAAEGLYVLSLNDINSITHYLKLLYYILLLLYHVF